MAALVLPQWLSQDMLVAAEGGYRPITNLLDPEPADAYELVALYHTR